MNCEITFIRGQTLETVLSLPSNIPADWFVNDETNTILTSHLRRIKNIGAGGLIAALTVTWESESSYRKVRVHADNTENWPLGPAEFDIVFVRTTNDPDTGLPVTRKIRSEPVQFTILDGVTR